MVHPYGNSCMAWLRSGRTMTCPLVDVLLYDLQTTPRLDSYDPVRAYDQSQVSNTSLSAYMPANGCAKVVELNGVFNAMGVHPIPCGFSPHQCSQPRSVYVCVYVYAYVFLRPLLNAILAQATMAQISAQLATLCFDPKKPTVDCEAHRKQKEISLGPRALSPGRRRV